MGAEGSGAFYWTAAWWWVSICSQNESLIAVQSTVLWHGLLKVRVLDLISADKSSTHIFSNDGVHDVCGTNQMSDPHELLSKANPYTWRYTKALYELINMNKSVNEINMMDVRSMRTKMPTKCPYYIFCITRMSTMIPAVPCVDAPVPFKLLDLMLCAACTYSCMLQEDIVTQFGFIRREK